MRDGRVVVLRGVNNFYQKVYFLLVHAKKTLSPLSPSPYTHTHVHTRRNVAQSMNHFATPAFVGLDRSYRSSSVRDAASNFKLLLRGGSCRTGAELDLPETGDPDELRRSPVLVVVVVSAGR